MDLLVVKDCDDRRETAWVIRRQLIGTAIGIPKGIIMVTPEDIERHKETIGLIVRPALKEGRVIYAA